MNGFTLMLLFAAQCFPVTASGNKSAQLFFCSIPGCGSNVTHVFCNDESLLSDGPIPNCTGPPPPNTVCQHKGFAFASTDSDAGCDFEGKDGLIESGKCTGFHRPSLTTAFPLVNATSQVPTRGRYGLIVGGVILTLPTVTEPLRQMEGPEGISDSDTAGLEDGGSTSHQESGV